MNPAVPTDVVDRLAAALTTTGALVAGITATQWNDPTCCPGWTVRTLTNHLVGGLRIFAAQLTGIEAGGEHDDDWLGGAAAPAYSDAAAAVLAAWRAPGAMDRTLHISLGPVPAPLGAVIELTEVVVHGLDLAVATGQTGRVDDDQAAGLHRLMRDMGVDAFRVPGVFGPAIDVPATAAAHQRLLAFLGRDVAALSLDPDRSP
jgi:uncharacterized protein (TIGR03086 family)